MFLAGASLAFVVLSGVLQAAPPGAGADAAMPGWAVSDAGRAVSPADDESWSALAIPGGVPRLFRALDLAPPADPASALLALARALYVAPEGDNKPLDARAAALVAYLRTQAPSGRAALDVPADHVPLPLSPLFWTETVFGARVLPDGLALALLADRHALWFYYGLASIDAPTRRFFEANPDLSRWVYRERASLLATMGRAIRVESDQVVLPGGDRDEAFWEELVGASTRDPARFVRRLLERDRGRLLWFYDVLAHLDRPGLARASASWRPAAERSEALRRLYDVFARFDPAWEPDRRPFTRPAVDPGLALMLVAAGPEHMVAESSEPADGRTIPWAPLWDHAFDSRVLPRRMPSSPSPEASSSLGPVSPPDPPPPAHLPRLLARIFEGPPIGRRARLDMVLFGQRRFARAAPAESLDVLIALVGFQRFPALMLALERLGVASAADYAAAARTAEQLSGGGSHLAKAVRLTAFQASLALLQHASRTRALGGEDVRRLAASLVRIPLAADGWHQGGVARWIDREFVPALNGSGPPDQPAGQRDSKTPEEPPARERRILRALAGIRDPDTRVVPTIEWEGHRYRVDPQRADLARIAEVRAKQGGNTLDSALALWSLAEPLAAGRLEARADPGTPRVGGLRPVPACTLFGRDLPDADTVISRVFRSVDRLGETVARSQVREKAVPLLRLVDTVMAETLVSLAYGLAIEDADALLLLGDNPALRHDLGLRGRSREESARLPWALATEAPAGSGPWHIEGSLLALERPLAPLALRRVSAEPPEYPPTLNKNASRTLLATLASRATVELSDAGRDRLAAAIRRGRDRVRESAGSREALDRLAAGLPMDEWRRQLLTWPGSRGPGGLEATFSLWELFLLGSVSDPGPEGTGETLDAWGADANPRDGSLALRLPMRCSWASLAGRPSTGLLASQVVDLEFRIVEWLSEYRLPAVLGRGVAAVALAEFLAGAAFTDDDDWTGMVRRAQGLTRERFEDCVSALTAGGPLIPIQGS